jgi:tripartite-type tricarboxylate transporter receptor subunit TctC
LGGSNMGCIVKSSLVAAGVLVAMGLGAAPAQSQQYTTQDIHFICAFPPGSGADVIVRYFAEKMRVVMGRTIIVENKVGAGGNIAMEFVGRSKPDGYTVFVHAGSAVAANMHLFKRPPFPDAAKAIQVVTTINRQPFMLLVDAKSPWKTVGDVTAAMKAKGAKGTYASAAPTGTVMGELYKAAAGLEVVEVVYKNAADSLNDMMSGTVDYGMHDPQFAMSQSREGRLRIIAVSTAKRLDANPDLPTMTEQGVPMDLTGWFAAMVPQGTSRPIVDQLNNWFREILAMDDTKKFLNSFGGDPMASTPEEGQERLVKDVEVWREYIRIAKIQPQG